MTSSTGKELINKVLSEKMGLRRRVADCILLIATEAGIAGVSAEEAKAAFDDGWRETVGAMPPIPDARGILQTP